MTRALRDADPDEIISIHMPHTWHDDFVRYGSQTPAISIHMPHTWHDRNRSFSVPAVCHFNPHATYVA